MVEVEDELGPMGATYAHSRAVIGSDLLLAALCEHHANRVVFRVVAAPVVVVVEPEPPPEPTSIALPVPLVPRSHPKVGDIISIVAQHFNITTMDLCSEHRQKNLIVPRHLAMYLARRFTPFGYPRLGHLFGGRDHTTILSAVKGMERRIEHGHALVPTITFLASEVDRMMLARPAA